MSNKELYSNLSREKLDPLSVFISLSLSVAAVFLAQFVLWRQPLNPELPIVFWTSSVLFPTQPPFDFVTTHSDSKVQLNETFIQKLSARCPMAILLWSLFAQAA
jgi:hypothetical protein